MESEDVTGSAGRRAGCLDRLFEEQVARSPGALALLGDGGPLTYGELDVRANRVAHRLVRLGVLPGEVVGLATRRTVDRVVGILGILKAGAAYLPLAPGDPPARREFILRETRARIAVLDESTASRPAAWAGVEPCVISAAGGGQEEYPVGPARAGSSGEAAYVVFTSGSTGLPKGVAATHRGVVRLFFGGDYVDLGPHRTLAHLAPLTFDAATFEIWGALLHGGRCLLVPESAETLPAIGSALRQHGVDTLWLTSALFNAWVEEPAVELDGIRQLLVGGEALSVSHVWRAQVRWPGVTLINGYGPTECTTFACCHRIPPDWPSSATSVPIGKPIAGTEAYVLDEQLRPVAPGEPGELHLAGDGLAIGYVNRPDLTRERFLEGPFPHVPAARLYRTGDRVRWLPDGVLEFLGRLDDQVKIRGHRIEPGEVGAALRDHPAVREALVMPLPRPDGVGLERALVAFVLVDPGAVGEDGLRRHLEARLPSHLIPERHVLLTQWPLTSNGKVDREALAALDRPASGGDAGGEPPANAVEACVAGVFAAILGLPRVGRDGHFFRLGGESLKAMRALGRINQALGRRISLGEFFRNPTVRGVAEGAAGDSRGVEVEPAAARGEAPGGDPASPAQERLWLLERAEPGNDAYRISHAVRWLGLLDVPALVRSWSALVARHEILRTHLVPDGEGLRQAVAADGVPGIQVMDLRERPAARRVASRHIRRSLRRPLDLERGPLVRAWLYRVGDAEQVFVVLLHHALGDDWSLKILERDLAELYRAEVTGTPPRLPPVESTYADYARWQRGWLGSPDFRTQLTHWRGQLAGLSAEARLPGDRPRPGGLRGRVGQCRRALSAERFARLRSLADEEAVTPFMLVLAALELWWERHLGRSDFGIGIPLANRPRAAWENTVGFFVNTLVLPSDAGGSPTFRQMLARVRTRVLEAFHHQEMPIEELVRDLNPGRDAGVQPLFQVFFNLLQVEGPGPRLPGVEVQEFELPHGRAMFDLAVYALDQGDRLTLVLAYDADLFRPATIEVMAARLEGFLGDLCDGPDLPVTRFSLLKHDPPGAQPEPDEVPAPPGHRPFRREEIEDSLAGRFQRVAREQAGRLAVRADDGQWTYAELDRESDRVAGELLRRFGAGGGRMALLYRPGIRMLAALLGVLKSGRAYVPLDPDHPAGRLTRILRDSGALVLLAGEECRALAEDLAWDGADVMIGGPPATGGEVAPAGPAVPPEAMAYLLYTSGSTGEPKGVIQNHRNVLHHIRCYTNRLKLAPGDRLSLFASYCFDASVMDIFGALLNGAELHLFDVRATPRADLIREIGVRQITVLHPTPTVFRHCFAEPFDPGCVAAVRLVVLGGEPAVRQDVAIHRERFPHDCRLINGLGPTESTLALQHVVRPGEEWGGDTVPVGRPVDGTRVELWNEAGEDVEICGEIVLLSEHLALGYWQRPEATGRAFLPPVGGSSVRRYRTGDVGRRLADGTLVFLGRRDFQVKIRGHRVEPGEIEKVLGQHPAVLQAMVLAARSDFGEIRLEAFVILRRVEDDLESLRGFLRARLPSYMVPTAIIRLEQFPLAPNGKVDRQTLGQLAREVPPTVEMAEPPSTPMERRLAELWQEVLGPGPVMRHDHFFEKGGHSLLGMRLLAAIQARLGVRLGFASLLTHPTLLGLATLCEPAAGTGGEETTAGAGVEQIPRLRRRSSGPDCPVSGPGN